MVINTRLPELAQLQGASQESTPEKSNSMFALFCNPRSVTLTGLCWGCGTGCVHVYAPHILVFKDWFIEENYFPNNGEGMQQAI